jgi:hypothetical protein
MRKTLNTMALVAAALAVSPAWAVNKCTGLDGAVMFQDAPCDAGAKKAETVRAAPAVTGKTRQEWAFQKGVDAMTGGVSCAAYSPIIYMSPQTSRDFQHLRVMVIAKPNGKFLAAVQILDHSSAIFHNQLDGMGLKTEPGAFHALGIKGGQKLVGFNDSTAAIDALVLSSSIRLRVRFWPYDRLLDSDSVSTIGLRQAVISAAHCAKSM